MEMTVAAKMIAQFYTYFDSLAAANPHMYHHVYEWNSIGNPDARLYQLNATPSHKGVLITYEFLPSSMPNDNGYVFVDKAAVMESGEMASFETDSPVPIGDGEFRVGRFTFKPGGDATTGAFGQAFMLYFGGMTIDRINAYMTMRPSSVNYAGGRKDAKRIYDRIANQ